MGYCRPLCHISDLIGNINLSQNTWLVTSSAGRWSTAPFIGERAITYYSEWPLILPTKVSQTAGWQGTKCFLSFKRLWSLIRLSKVANVVSKLYHYLQPCWKHECLTFSLVELAWVVYRPLCNWQMVMHLPNVVFLNFNYSMTNLNLQIKYWKRSDSTHWWV